MEIMSDPGPRSSLAQDVQGFQDVLAEQAPQLRATRDAFSDPPKGQSNGAIRNRQSEKIAGIPAGALGIFRKTGNQTLEPDPGWS